MNRPKCVVNGCEREGFVAYGGQWICGEHMVKVINKEKEKQSKEIEDLGNE